MVNTTVPVVENSEEPKTESKNVDVSFFPPLTVRYFNLTVLTFFSDRVDNIWYRLRGMAAFFSIMALLAAMNVVQLFLLVPLHLFGYKRLSARVNTWFA